MNVADLDRLPAPYPGELWYSVVARDVARAGYSQREFRPLMALGGLTASINLAYPNRIHRLLASIRDRSQLDMVGFARRHTLLPYLMAFEPVTRLDDLLHASAASNRPLSDFLGNTRNLLDPMWMRYCKTCRHEDRMTVGEPYWHSAHQLSFVINCYRHGDRLFDSLVPYQPRRHEFWTAHDVLCAGKELTKVAPGMEVSHPLTREIGRLSLRAAEGPANLHFDRMQYVSILKGVGFEGKFGDVASTRLSDALARFINAHGSRLETFGSRGWWRGLYTRLSSRVRPIQHVTMRIFLWDHLLRIGATSSQHKAWEAALMGAPV